MMRPQTLFLLLVLVAGCGRKTQPAPEPAPQAADTSNPAPGSSSTGALDLSLVPTGVVLISIEEPAAVGDPVVAGKPVSAWRADLASPDDAVAATAMRVLLASGPPNAAVADLLDARQRLRSKGYEFGLLRQNFGPGTLPGLVAALKSPNRPVRESAAVVIGIMGPAASRAVPELTAAADKAEHYGEFSAILTALEQIGPVSKAAIPMLAEELKHKEPLFRWAAARQLAILGVTTPEVYAALVEPFDHPDGLFHCSESSFPLSFFGERGLAVIWLPKNREKPQVTMQFVRSLWRLGERAGPVVEHYTKQLSDPDLAHVQSACSMLGAIGRPAAPATAELVKLVRGGPETCRTAAAQALGKVATDASSALPALKERLEKSPEREVIFAIGELHSYAKADVVAAIKPLLAKPEDESAQWAAFVLVKFAPEVGELYPPLVARNKYSNFPLPDVTRQSLPGLRKLLTSQDKSEREVAAQAVVRLDPADEAARRIFLASDWLEVEPLSRPPAMRISAGSAAAAVALGKDGVAPLVRFLSDAEASVRISAAHTLGRIGPEAKGAKPELQKMLASTSAAEQLAAAEALAAIDPKDRVSLPALLELARPENRAKLREIADSGQGSPADRLATALWAIDPESAAKSGALVLGNVVR